MNISIIEANRTINTLITADMAKAEKAGKAFNYEKSLFHAQVVVFGYDAARKALETRIMNSSEFIYESTRTDIHALNVSDGNNKLVKTDKGEPVNLGTKKKPHYLRDENGELVIAGETVRYIIWNIEALLTCRCGNGSSAGDYGATNECIKQCYADGSAETYGYNVIHSRMMNFAAAINPMFEKNMNFTIARKMSSRSYAAADKVIFRIHESGEFFNQSYLSAFINVCKDSEKYSNLVFNYYTKSTDLFENAGLTQAEIDNNHKNMRGRASVWGDSSAAFLECIERNGYRTYSAVEEFTTETEQQKCFCRSCATCSKCISNVNNVIVEIH